MLRRVAVPLLLFISFFVRAQTSVPVISSVTPESGPVGSEVTITGQNFGADPQGAIVYFGAAKAIVTHLSPTEIKTRVPAGATYKPVSVLVNKLSAFSPKPFIVTSTNETLINAGSFTAAVSLEIGGAPYDVAASDLDDDGKPDLVVASYSAVSVLRNTSTKGSLTSSSFGPKVDIVTNAISASSLAMGDLDGDGKTDIVAISGFGNANSVTVIRNNSTPGFINAASFQSFVFAVGSNPQKVTLADLDLDGKLDVITANGNNSISILHASSDEFGIAFESHVDINLTTPGTAETVAAADMDLDGKPDLVEYNFSNNQYTISVLRNLSESRTINLGSFALPVSFGAGAISDSDIAIGDLDNDGRPDMLANFGSNNTLSVLKNLSVPGNFNTASFATKVDFGTGTNPVCGKAIADINGDGHPDIISTNRESNTWSVFQNKEQPGVINTASFLPKVDFTTGQKPTGVAAADFDGDGMTDVVVVCRESRTASVYRNQMADPQVLSFSPQSGNAGTVVTLTGVNFGSVASGITIGINGTKANIDAITPASISLTVPAGATTGPLSATRNGATTSTGTEFTILPVTVTSFSPTTAFVGEQVIIKGTGFSSKPAGNVVKIGGIQAEVLSSTAGEIRITVPVDVVTGMISVTVNQSATATSTQSLLISPVGITAYNFPELFTNGGPAVEATLSYTNVESVSAIRFMTRGITQSGDFHEDNVEITASGEASFMIPAAYFNDPIGLQMKFMIVDVDGKEIFRESYTYKKFLKDDPSQDIPGLTFGTDTENYHIISIPLELTSRSVSNVFRQLGEIDPTQWRLFSFDQGLDELKTRNAPIYSGTGYWLIARDEVTINPGEGTTLYANSSKPFVMTLKPGWNLIGNPYNFTMSWEDVLSYNGSPLSVGTLRQFDAMTFSVNNRLDRFRGAFVRNDSTTDVHLKIPVTNTAGSSRKRARDEDPRNWEIALTVSDGKLSNSLGGFGMNGLASESKDRLDEVALPLPFATSFDFIMRGTKENIKGNIIKENIIKDIVPASENYTWNGSVNSLNGVTLSWDNIATQRLTQELWIELPGHPLLVDMRLANHIDLPAGPSSFRVVYGDRKYVLQSTQNDELLVGDVSPNPLPKTSHVFSLPVNFIFESNAVQLDIIDMRGTKTRRSFTGTFTRGRNVIEWQENLSQLPTGIYLLAITIAAGDSSRTLYRKFILE